jgi:hypothetical protein
MWGTPGTPFTVITGMVTWAAGIFTCNIFFMGIGATLLCIVSYVVWERKEGYNGSSENNGRIVLTFAEVIDLSGRIIAGTIFLAVESDPHYRGKQKLMRAHRGPVISSRKYPEPESRSMNNFLSK